MCRRVCPECGSKTIQTSRNTLTNQYAELYVVCTNTASCGGGYVVSESFKHWTNPPQQTIKQMAAEIIGNLPRQEQLDLLGRFG